MFTINEGKAKINGKNVDTFSRIVDTGNTVLRVEAGTTGYSGGDDRESGRRTYVEMVSKNATT